MTVVYLLSLRAYFVGFFNDDAFYLIGGRSLLQGRYVELSTPGEPPLDNYPPGYPILLAQLGWFTGDSLLAPQLLGVALTTASVWLVWLCLATELPAAAAFAAAGVTAFNPLTVSLSGTVLSDVPFLAVSLLLLLAARQRWKESQARSFALIGALAGYLCLVRTSGAAMLLALVLSLLAEKRWRAALSAGASGGAVFGAYLLRNRLVSGRSETRLVEILDPYRGADWAAAAAALWRNAGFYAHEIFGRTLFRWPEGPGKYWLDAITLVLCSAGLLAGLRTWTLKGWRKLPVLYLLISCGVILFWPKQSGRYVLALLPLAAALLFLGLDRLDSRLKLSGKALWSTLALSLVLSAAPVGGIVAASLWKHTPLNTPPLRTAQWFKSATEPADILAAELDGRLYLLTGRRTMHLRKIYEPEAFFRWITDNRVAYVLSFPTDYIMRTPKGRGEYDPVPLETLSALLSDGRRYEPVFHDDAEGSVIYRVKLD